MPDNPREILKAAGVECAEVDEWLEVPDVTIDDVSYHASAAILALATRLAAIVSYFEAEMGIDDAAPWALGEIRRVLAEHDSDRGA